MFAIIELVDFRISSSLWDNAESGEIMLFLTWYFAGLISEEGRQTLLVREPQPKCASAYKWKTKKLEYPLNALQLRNISVALSRLQLIYQINPKHCMCAVIWDDFNRNDLRKPTWNAIAVYARNEPPIPHSYAETDLTFWRFSQLLHHYFACLWCNDTWHSFRWFTSWMQGEIALIWRLSASSSLGLLWAVKLLSLALRNLLVEPIKSVIRKCVRYL